MIPLHVVSSYSLAFGVHGPERWVRHFRERGAGAMALTDRENLYGLHPFLEACAESGVRPIVGAELGTPGGSLLVLCVTAEGFAHLCTWITAAKASPLTPPLTLDRIRAAVGPGTGDDLFCIVFDATLLRALAPHFPDHARAGQRRRIFAGLRGPDLAYARAAKHLGFPLVAAPRFLCLSPDDAPVHRVLRAIGGNTTVYRTPADAGPVADAIDPAVFEAFPGAVAHTHFIADAITWAPTFPLVFPTVPGVPSALLRKAAFEGAQRRFGELSDSVLERLEYELGIIEQKGFSAYFLVVQDIVRRSPRVCGRGSGAASLVAYSLGITNVDPLRHHLYFERFLHPERTDMPDIDVDFAWDERDAVIAQVMQAYGPQRCAMVCTHVGYQARAALREAARAYGLSDAEIGAMQKEISGQRLTADGTRVSRMAALQRIRADAPWPEIFAVAARLKGLPRHLGVHPGGLIITPGPVARHAPVERAPKGVPIITWEKDGAEAGGLVKIDLLGNRSLAVIRDALANLRDNGHTLDEAAWVPEDDADTVALLARGDSMGVFYVESPAMRQLQKKTGRGDFEHLVIHSSIIRPAANRFIAEYVKRLHGAPVPPLHPAVDRLLAETYGVLCYQEDVSRVAVALAGFSASHADRLRKILTKKNRADRIASFRDEFFAGAAAHGATQPVIQTVWDMMLSFDGYSFCKPHSASYAMVSFQSAYLKAHFPAEFMAGVISNQGGYYSLLAYVGEARRLGLALEPPQVNTSAWKWRGQGKTLRIGLMSVSGLHHETGHAIVRRRLEGGPYVDAADFFRRVRPAARDLDALVAAGALDGLGQTRPRQLALGLMMLRSDPGFGPAPRLPEGPDWSAQEKRVQFFRRMGFTLDAHPLSLFELPGRGRFRAAAAKTGQRVTFWAWPVTAKTVLTHRSEPMQFVSFEDETAIFEAVAFPQVYLKIGNLLEDPCPCRITGTWEDDQGAQVFHLDDVLEKSTRLSSGGRRRTAGPTSKVKSMDPGARARSLWAYTNHVK